MTENGPVLTGGCQCGAVRYRLARPPSRVSVCFCRMCQKAVGGYFGAYASSRAEDVVWTRGELSLFRSSEVAERGFCGVCGTPLSFSYRGSGRLSVSTGSLDDPAAFPPGVAHGIEGRVPFFADICELEGTRTEDDIPADEMVRYRSRQHPDHDTER
ncbi:GFA family protein [Bosea sp. BK604]|uniref:GFA family protein n=1 Tax=Bosea sp. BK604 TaxID=2512180 RepID=UPI0010438D62|nr:GFA family protein [Bosea sp. BK604]